MEIYGNYEEIKEIFNDELNYAKNDDTINKEWVQVVENDMQKLLEKIKDIKLLDFERFYVCENPMGGFNYAIQEIQEEDIAEELEHVYDCLFSALQFIREECETEQDYVNLCLMFGISRVKIKKWLEEVLI